MIRQEDIRKLTDSDIEATKRIYDELMRNGMDAVPLIPQRGKLYGFSKICHDLIHQYILWNDYLHSNNVMQLFKDNALQGNSGRRPVWYIRYEILIYGKRTPLYFIENPIVLFEKIQAICEQNNEKQTDKLSSVIESLFNYYKHSFLSQDASRKDKELFASRFLECFAKEYRRYDCSIFPPAIRFIFNDFVEYFENPDLFIEPGVSKSEQDMWDEDEDSIFYQEEISDDSVTIKPEVIPEKIQCSEYTRIIEDVSDIPDDKLTHLRNKSILFIGQLSKPSIKNKLWGISKRFEFRLDAWDDYDKITNKNFESLRYSNRIDGIIVGPMPHSAKGKGEYSSVLEMMLREPGFPPVVKCIIAGDKLKITATSLWKALIELDNELSAL